jgi:hypothetical protein
VRSLMQVRILIVLGDRDIIFQRASLRALLRGKRIGVDPVSVVLQISGALAFD